MALARRSADSQHVPQNRNSQAPEAREFAARFENALGGRGLPWLAGQTGEKVSTLHEYRKGRIPRADKAMSIADALGVSPRWFLSGAGPKHEGATDDNAELVELPAYELSEFTEHGKPAPSGRVPLRRDQLQPIARSFDGLWTAIMPTAEMPDVAREGDTLILQNVQPPLQDGRVYALLLDGRPVIRRIQNRPEGLRLSATGAGIDPVLLSGDDIERLVPVGRVLAAVNVAAV